MLNFVQHMGREVKSRLSPGSVEFRPGVLNVVIERPKREVETTRGDALHVFLDLAGPF